MTDKVQYNKIRHCQKYHDVQPQLHKRKTNRQTRIIEHKNEGAKTL